MWAPIWSHSSCVQHARILAAPSTCVVWIPLLDPLRWMSAFNATSGPVPCSFRSKVRWTKLGGEGPISCGWLVLIGWARSSYWGSWDLLSHSGWPDEWCFEPSGLLLLRIKMAGKGHVPLVFGSYSEKLLIASQCFWSNTILGAAEVSFGDGIRQKIAQVYPSPFLFGHKLKHHSDFAWGNLFDLHDTW